MHSACTQQRRRALANVDEGTVRYRPDALQAAAVMCACACSAVNVCCRHRRPRAYGRLTDIRAARRGARVLQWGHWRKRTKG